MLNELRESDLLQDDRFVMLQKRARNKAAWVQFGVDYSGGTVAEAKKSLLALTYGAQPMSDLPPIRMLAHDYRRASDMIVSLPKHAWSAEFHKEKPHPVMSRLASIMSFRENDVLQTMVSSLSEVAESTAHCLLYDGAVLSCRNEDHRNRIEAQLEKDYEIQGIRSRIKPWQTDPWKSVAVTLFERCAVQETGETLSALPGVGMCLLDSVRFLSFGSRQHIKLPDGEYGPFCACDFNSWSDTHAWSLKLKYVGNHPTAAATTDDATLSPADIARPREFLTLQQMGSNSHWFASRINFGDNGTRSCQIFDSLWGKALECCKNVFVDAHLSADHCYVFELLDSIDVDACEDGDEYSLKGGGRETDDIEEKLVPIEPSAHVFLNSMRDEVSAYADLLKVRIGGKTPYRCKLCPKRTFARKDRLLHSHLKHHCARSRYCASGTKQLRVAQAIYDDDKFRRESTGRYLERSAQLIRSQVGDCLIKNNNLVRHEITLVLCSDGPRFYPTKSIRLHNIVRRCTNKTNYTKEFATFILQQSILVDASLEALRNVYIGVSQRNGNLLTSLIPAQGSASDTWGAVMADICSFASVRALKTNLINECEDNGEFMSLSIDGTVKSTFTLKGQASAAAPLSVKKNQAISHDESKYHLLTMRGITSAVVAVQPAHGENAESVANMINTELTYSQRSQIRHVAVDCPSNKLFKLLKLSAQNLDVISLCAPHVAMAYDSAKFGGKGKSPGSKYLRDILSKFAAVEGPTVPTTYYCGFELLKQSRNEKRLIINIRRKNMQKRLAERLFHTINCAKRYRSRDEFIGHLAALAKLFPKEMNKTIPSQGRTRLSMLVATAAPSRVEWLLNATRFRSTLKLHQLTFMPSGVASNEALHNELKLILLGQTMYAPLFDVKMFVFVLGKLLAHNSALYAPTSTSYSGRESYVLTRVVCSLDPFGSEPQWRSWCLASPHSFTGKLCKSRLQFKQWVQQRGSSRKKIAARQGYDELFSRSGVVGKISAHGDECQDPSHCMCELIAFALVFLLCAFAVYTAVIIVATNA